MLQYSIVNGKTFQILEDLDYPRYQSFGEKDRIAIYEDKVCLLHDNMCYFKIGVEEWLEDVISSKWINKDDQFVMIDYLNMVLKKMVSYKRVQTLYEILEKDDYYNNLILAC